MRFVRAPFLGQGANQALQDAYSLALHVRDFNQRDAPTRASSSSASSSAEQADQDSSATGDDSEQFGKAPLVLRVLDTAYELFWLAVNVALLLLLNRKMRTAVQEMAYSYEKRRKAHSTLVAVLARAVGTTFTLSGPVGHWLKLVLLRLLVALGLAEFLFCLPMKPVV